MKVVRASFPVHSSGGLLGGVFVVLESAGKCGIVMREDVAFVADWQGGFVIDMVCIKGMLTGLTNCGVV